MYRVSFDAVRQRSDEAADRLNDGCFRERLREISHHCIGTRSEQPTRHHVSDWHRRCSSDSRRVAPLRIEEAHMARTHQVLDARPGALPYIRPQCDGITYV